MASEVSRQELQAAIAKAVELRALHAVLTHGSNSSPVSLRLLPGALPCDNRYPGEDYPIFTPSYDEEPHLDYHRLRSETLAGSMLEGETREDDADHFSQIIQNKSPSMRREQQICLADDHRSNTSLCAHHIGIAQCSPTVDSLNRVRENSSSEFRFITTCNKCKPASISREADEVNKNSTMIVMPSNTRSSAHLQPKSRPPILSWLFPRSKKKPKSELSSNSVESEEMSQLFKNWGTQTFESLKKELNEANESRDAALVEVGEMRSILGELKQKMAQLETYCEELKKALKQAMQGREPSIPERRILARRAKSIRVEDDNNLMPVSHEAMVEGFLQMVSETRLSVQQFCKTLIDEVDAELLEKLNSLIQPHNLSTTLKNSKGMVYHLEALTNRQLYQNFENCVFEKNGSPKSLDRHRNRHDNFSAFVSLRNLSWNEVLRKGTKYHSEEFSGFCDQKMSSIATLLDWSAPWPEQLLHSFFVSAKCIWLLHLLAFSFDPPLPILRVEENRSFDAIYMEDVLLERHRARPPARVKTMVVPGFYVQDSVLKCKVLCRYRSAP